MKKTLLTMVVALMATVSVSAQIPKRYNTENHKRGVELVEEGKLEEGLKFLEAELKEHPKNPYTNYYITTVYMELKQYDKAMASVDKALKYMPKRNKNKEMRGIAHALKATLHSGYSEWEEAVEQLTLCLSTLPKNQYGHRAVAYRQRGEIYYHKLGQHELAEQDFKKAEELMSLLKTE